MVLEGVAIVAYFIACHEQTQYNRAIFVSFVWSLLPTDLTIRNLFIERTQFVCGGQTN